MTLNIYAVAGGKTETRPARTGELGQCVLCADLATKKSVESAIRRGATPFLCREHNLMMFPIRDGRNIFSHLVR